VPEEVDEFVVAFVGSICNQPMCSRRLKFCNHWLVMQRTEVARQRGVVAYVLSQPIRTSLSILTWHIVYRAIATRGRLACTPNLTPATAFTGDSAGFAGALFERLRGGDEGYEAGNLDFWCIHVGFVHWQNRIGIDSIEVLKRQTQWM
jgi:hypothetical protein